MLVAGVLAVVVLWLVVTMVALLLDTLTPRTNQKEDEPSVASEQAQLDSPPSTPAPAWPGRRWRLCPGPGGTVWTRRTVWTRVGRRGRALTSLERQAAMVAGGTHLPERLPRTVSGW